MMEKIDLQRIYKKKKTDRDIFQELMPFKIREVLLIANYYDAYFFEREGLFSDRIFGEYLQLQLYTTPHFISAASEKEAMKLLAEKQVDLIVIMAGVDKKNPPVISSNLKALYPDILQLMLVNNNADLDYFNSIEDSLYKSIERIFVWNGSTRLFLAMAKYIEDRKNLEADTKLGDVRVILLVEDSVKYYSRYLPILYTEIMVQTQALFANENKNEILQVRARPKVILVSNFEAAVTIIDHYKKNLIGVISDVRYKRNNIEDEDAGVELIKYVLQADPKIPCLLQSHEQSNARRAEAIQAEFINKNSSTLAHEIQKFIKERLGFGDFIFRNESGEPIDKATSIKEFKQKLATLSDVSLKYHTLRNDISTWTMARGEINLAKKLRLYRFEDFKTIDELRKFIFQVFKSSELKKMRGRIIGYRPEVVKCNHYITRMGKGTLGGKGRGMAFLSNFIENVDLKKLIPNLKIAIPQTTIIGVEEYDRFIEMNGLTQTIYHEKDYEVIKQAFLKASLSSSLREQLKSYLDVIKKPLAVRSSGLFEDSLNQPFAGVYATYLIPNNHPSSQQRLQELEEAIKLVYASIFTDSSRAYFNAVNYMIEEEKMAVILQEVTGNEVNGRYYPNISGVAQSYNFYPFSYIQPEDGFSVIALGLGAYVVGGEKTYRFCPGYPKLQLASIQDQIRDSQQYFYAIDMHRNRHYNLAADGEHAAIKAYELEEIEKDGNLAECASVYDFMEDRIVYDLNVKGNRIINFPGILQFDKIPLANALNILLDVFSQAMGSPVEMEFSLNIENQVPVFYLLQIKPLIKNDYIVDIDQEEFDSDKMLLRATNGMGNGKITNICDVIYINPEQFNRLKTEEIAEEVKKFNIKLQNSDTPYILIGPGRWGTRDRLTGIPVVWSDISNAKVIVEQGLEDFPLDASLGSHFFHNVTSMNVGYFAIPFAGKEAFIDFDVLAAQEIVEEFTFTKHVRFAQPLTIFMDGKKQISVIQY